MLADRTFAQFSQVGSGGLGSPVTQGAGHQWPPPATPPGCTVPPWAVRLQGACVVLEWRAGWPGPGMLRPAWADHLSSLSGKNPSHGPRVQARAVSRALCCHLLALPGTAGSGPGPPADPGGSLQPSSIQETPGGGRGHPQHPHCSPLHRTSGSHPWGCRTRKLRSCPRWVVSPAGPWAQAGPSCAG